MAIKIRPLSHALGAELSGVDLSKPVDAATRAEIHKAWLDHLVIVFRGQELTPERQIAFGHMFGELDDHKAVPFYRHPEHPEIYLITNKKIGGKESQTKDTGRLWHSDHSFTTRPTTATMLYCREIPPVGGTTMFANMYMAYETLSPGLRAVLDKLEAVHSLEHYTSHNPYFGVRDQAQVAKMHELSPPVAQPVVRVHPETGRKALFVSEGQTSRFVGMSQEESNGLLQYLFAHSVKPEFTYRHTWNVRDMLMWDNRCAMHLALADYSHEHTRHMHRLTVLGTPSGRFLQPTE
ncbi:MAG: TauD/TfdA dioxygenase family protein [Burkholderiaceae bacterium]